MSKKKKNSKPKKVDVLKLSKSEKAHLLKKAKDNLRQKLVEAKFWQSFAETERVTINGYKIDF
jgi:tRNA A37 threonylcarbamoyladenosine dehydratase